jgi:sec-independent protein translocase protein TatA
MSIGIWQVVLILVIVLIIFGAGKIPQVMGDVAKGIKSFKSGLKDDEQPKPLANDAQITADAVKKDERASG